MSIRSLFTRAQHMRGTGALLPSYAWIFVPVDSEVPVMISCLHASCDTWQRCQSEAFSLVHSMCDSQMPFPSYSWSLFVDSEVPVMLGCVDSSCDNL